MQGQEILSFFLVKLWQQLQLSTVSETIDLDVFYLASLVL
jgi:hypothetical protein